VRKLLALIFSGPLLTISIVTLSLITSTLAFTPANAAPNSIEIISISEVSSTSVEILFKSSISKKSLSYYVINAVEDLPAGTPKNIKKIIKTKATGLITAEIKNLNPKAAYKFSVSAKTNKAKMISSEAVEYSSLSNLMDVLSNLPADWGNPKPTPTPVAAPAAAAAPAAKVAITRASIGTSPGIAFTTQPQITIQDSGGNTITSSNAVVTATVSAGGTLVGTATATASSGVSTFSNLGIRGFSGTAYTITYTAPDLTTATQSVTPSALIVGDTGPGGGNIFYVAATSAGFDCGPTTTETCYYLEAASTTATTNPWTDAEYAWSGNTTVLIGATAQGTAIGTGYKNTLAIIGQSGGGNTAERAGTISRAYGGPNTLTDWFLPSQNELNQMCKWARGQAWTSDITLCNGTGVLNTGSGAAGFVGNYYWSSSEDSAVTAWLLYFGNGYQLDDGKDRAGYVRPVRAF